MAFASNKAQKTRQTIFSQVHYCNTETLFRQVPRGISRSLQGFWFCAISNISISCSFSSCALPLQTLAILLWHSLLPWMRLQQEISVLCWVVAAAWLCNQACHEWLLLKQWDTFFCNSSIIAMGEYKKQYNNTKVTEEASRCASAPLHRLPAHL